MSAYSYEDAGGIIEDLDRDWALLFVSLTTRNHRGQRTRKSCRSVDRRVGDHDDRKNRSND